MKYGKYRNRVTCVLSCYQTNSVTEVQPVYICPMTVLERPCVTELKLAIVDKIAAIDENQQKLVQLPETFAIMHKSKQRPYAQYNFFIFLFMFNK